MYDNICLRHFKYNKKILVLPNLYAAIEVRGDFKASLKLFIAHNWYAEKPWRLVLLLKVDGGTLNKLIRLWTDL